MQTLTRTYMIVIEDFDLMTIMDENLNWMKLPHLFPNFSLNVRAPLLYTYAYFIKLDSLFRCTH